MNGSVSGAYLTTTFGDFPDEKAKTLLGVPGNQVTTVSYDSEKPRRLDITRKLGRKIDGSDIVYIGIDAHSDSGGRTSRLCRVPCVN
jgi:hypothetical protein